MLENQAIFVALQTDSGMVHKKIKISILYTFFFWEYYEQNIKIYIGVIFLFFGKSKDYPGKV